MATKNLGKDMVVCRNSGTFGSPAHIPLIGARNIKIANKPSAMIDSTDRVSASTIITPTEIPTRRSLSVAFDIMWNAGAGATALRTAFLAGTPILLAVFNKFPTASAAAEGVGYMGDWLVKKFPTKMPLADGQMIDIEIVPHGNYTNAVATYTDTTTTLGTPESQVTKKLGKNGSVNDSSNDPITAVRDFSFSAEWETAKSSDRGCVFDTEIPTQRKITADVEFMWEEANTQIVAFRTAWEAGNPITLSLLDGAYLTAGSYGPKADWAISDHPVDANLNDGQLCKVKLVPHGNYSTAFAFVTTS